MSWLSKVKKLSGTHFIKTGPTTAKCKICGQEIRAEKSSELSLLAAVYRHFKERHPKVLESEVEAKPASKIDEFLE